MGVFVLGRPEQLPNLRHEKKKFRFLVLEKI